MNKLTKGRQRQLAKWVESKSNLELDFVVKMVEDRIDYDQSENENITLLVEQAEKFPGLFVPVMKAITVIEKHREKVNKEIERNAKEKETKKKHHKTTRPSVQPIHKKKRR